MRGPLWTCTCCLSGLFITLLWPKYAFFEADPGLKQELVKSTVTWMSVLVNSWHQRPKTSKNPKIQATKIWSNKRLFGLFIFLRSLITKKSSCMEKPCVWVVFHPNDYPSQKNNFSWRYILGQDYWVLCITLGAPSHHNQFESLTLPSPVQHPKCLYVLSIKAHLAFPKSFCLLFQVLLNVTLHVHTCS